MNAETVADDVIPDIETYEQLRGAVLLAQACPEGLAAVVYHGLFGGLKVIGAGTVSTPASPCLPVPATSVEPVPSDPALVRLLANMVLLYQQEVSHVV